MSERILIVNADDFGASPGINAGIVQAHTHGVVTSTSLMVTGAGLDDAVTLARAHPALSIGLHWDLDGEGEPRVDFGDHDAVREELERQLTRFEAVMGRPPTHLDSHHHVHRHEDLAGVFAPLAERVGRPLRGQEPVSFVGGFYGQWEHGVTDLQHVSPEFFVWLLENEVPAGVTEIGCHPGRVTGDFVSTYLEERETELASLCAPEVRTAIRAGGIRLIGFGELDLERG